MKHYLIQPKWQPKCNHKFFKHQSVQSLSDHSILSSKYLIVFIFGTTYVNDSKMEASKDYVGKNGCDIIIIVIGSLSHAMPPVPISP